MTSTLNTRPGRWKLWLPLLTVAVWLAFFGDKTPGNLAAPAKPAAPAAGVSAAAVPVGRAPVLPRPAARTPAASASAPLEALVPRSELLASAQGKPLRDLFATGSWTPPAPAPIQAPAPRPEAPPLPFAYMGMKLEGDTREVFLSQGEQTLIAREGAQLLNVYRVEKISPAAMTLTYLPLGQIQTLPIGDFR